MLCLLDKSHAEYQRVVNNMRRSESSILVPLNNYEDVQVFRVTNKSLRRSFRLKKRQIRCDLGGGQGAQVQLFHASPNARAIVRLGFDLVSPGQTDRTVTLSSDWSAVTLDKTCQEHGSFICTKCTRQVLFCDCLLGRHLNCSHQLTSGFQFGLKKWHSVAVESDSCGALFPDILLRDCEQALPIYLVEYKLSALY